MLAFNNPDVEMQHVDDSAGHSKSPLKPTGDMAKSLKQDHSHCSPDNGCHHQHQENDEDMAAAVMAMQDWVRLLSGSCSIIHGCFDRNRNSLICAAFAWKILFVLQPIRFWSAIMLTVMFPSIRVRLIE